MSRTIDADAFIEFLRDAIKQQKYDNLKIDELLTVADVIEAIITELDGTSILGFKNAPTIEPQRKKGHWIRHPEQRNIFNGKTIECSECHEKYTVQYVEDEWFCRHCGADMREDGEADENSNLDYRNM